MTHPLQPLDDAGFDTGSSTSRRLAGGRLHIGIQVVRQRRPSSSRFGRPLIVPVVSKLVRDDVVAAGSWPTTNNPTPIALGLAYHHGALMYPFIERRLTKDFAATSAPTSQRPR